MATTSSRTEPANGEAPNDGGPATPRLGRRTLLGAAAGGAVVAAGGLGYHELRSHRSIFDPSDDPGDDVTGSATHTLHTRIDITPPVIDIKVPAASGVAPGYVFLGTKHGDVQPGLVVLDNTGQLVWSDIYYAEVTDFRVQEYQGKPTLTYWYGQGKWDHGVGQYALVDSRYHQIGSVRVGSGYNGDLHEFHLTRDGTAMVTIYHEVRADLSSVGGPADGWVWEGVAQEIDIATGRVLFEWHSLDHVPLSDSYYDIKDAGTRAQPYDYFHINSVDKNADGDYLISSRCAHTLFKVDGRTGAVKWRLGGKRSHFDIDPDAVFLWQHCARFQANGRVSVFDNHMSGHSRGLILNVDESKRRATLHREYVSPEKLLANYQANMEVLSNGNVFIGWGDQPYFTEFAPDGTVLFHASFRSGNSYRAYRAEWVAEPTDRPLVTADRQGDSMRVYVSWNGATEVAAWRLSTGDDRGHLATTHKGARAGFETAFTVPAARYVRASALDRHGRVLGTSETVAAFTAG